MITQKYTPPDDLRLFVKSYFIQEIDLDTRGLLIPALTQTLLQFNYGELFLMQDSTGHQAQFYPVTLTGILTTYWHFTTQGSVKPRYLAIELHPYVPFLLFAEKNRQLINSSIDAAEHFDGSEEFRRSVAAAEDPDEKIEWANHYLTNLFSSASPFDDEEIVHALEVMDAPAEYTTIETRLSRLSRNPRNFRTKFKRVIGVSPKLFMRIRRMEKVLSDMHQHPDEQYLQKLHGFYDQPHFIRECKLFTGRTPTAIFAPFKDESVRKIHNNLS